MSELIRYDIYMDNTLHNEVERAIEHLYYQLNERQENIPFTMHELADALIAKGYPTDNKEESIKPYMDYVCRRENLILVKLRHGDCCLRQYSDKGVILFSGYHARGGVHVNHTCLTEVVKIIEKIDASLPEIVKKCQEGILQEEKKAKQKAINRKTIDTVIKSTLKDTGIKYKLSFSEHKALLTLQLNNGLETNIYLSYKDFMAKIPFVKSTVEQLNDIMDKLGQPLRIKATYYKEKDIWTESY